MKIYDFKKWVSNIPDDYDEVDLEYADFLAWEELTLLVRDSGAVLVNGVYEEGRYVDRRTPMVKL
jgi:hypothetical protein